MFSGLFDLFGSSDKKTSYKDHIRPILQHMGKKLTHSDCFHWLDQKVVIHLQRYDNPQIGTVKYIGSDDKGVLCAGIEFEYNIGGMSGKVNGQKLFKCQPGHGLLIPAEYVGLLEDYENGTNIFPVGQRGSSSHRHINRTSSVPNLTSRRPNSDAPTELDAYVSHTLPELKVGDNVVWLGGTTPQSGVVKWIGRVGRNNQTSFKVWMEMDEYMGFGRNEIDMGTKFGCAAGRGRLLPVEELILLEHFIPEETTVAANTPRTSSFEMIPDTPQSIPETVRQSDETTGAAVGDLIDLSEENAHVNDNRNRKVLVQDFVNICNIDERNKYIGNKRSSIDELVNNTVSPSADMGVCVPPQSLECNIPLDEPSPTNNVTTEFPDLEIAMDVDVDVNGNVPEPDKQATLRENPLENFPVKLVSESEEDYLPPFIIPPINIVEFFKAEGVKGIQGRRNSCYIDVVLFSMFAFNDTFDPYFLVKTSYFSKVPDSVITKTAKRILSEKIVNPLRQNYYCPAGGVNTLRQLMVHVAKCDKMDGAFLDIEEFMLILFQKVFQLKEFIEYDNEMKDFLYQVNLGDHRLPPVMTLKQCLELSMHDHKLKRPPSPAFIIQIPRNHSGIIQSTTIVPNLSLTISSGNEAPTLTVMNLVAVICINDFHFVTFVKSGKGPLSHWVLFDSNPSEERPKVEIVSNMGEYLESMEHQCLTSPSKLFENKHKFPPHVLRLLSDIYVCIYCPADVM